MIRSKALKRIKELGSKECLDLFGLDLQDNDIKEVVKALKDTHITELILGENLIGDDGAKYIAELLPHTQIKKLVLSDNNIKHEGANYLSQSLIYSQLLILDLYNNNLGDRGVANLAQGLKGTQIKKLNLSANEIGNDGLRCLASVLKDTEITEIFLERNEIGFSGARYLNEALFDTKLEYYVLHIFLTEESRFYIHQYMHSSAGSKNIGIILRGNEIGINGAQYLNQLFKYVPLHRLNISHEDLKDDDAKYFAQAFRGIIISDLTLHMSHFLQKNGVRYLIEAFKGVQIAKINIEGDEMKSADAQCLAEFLKEIVIPELSICWKRLDDESLVHLEPALITNPILKLYLMGNEVNSTGIKCLAPVFKHNLITHIDLSSNAVGDEGAKYLAEGLKNSQVTHIDISKNQISEAGYQYLADVVDDTNICLIQFSSTNYADIERSATTTTAYKIRHAFETLVRLNPLDNNFQFTLPEKIQNCIMEEYTDFIKSITHKPQVKAHIFNMMCYKAPDCFDFDMMQKVNQFIENLSENFNTFFNENFPALPHCDYVKVLEDFEDVNLSDIVQNLLLHRGLYYVDDNQEILHPYVYLLLHKHKMVLFDEKLEPHKKEAIISFYQNHLDDAYVQEALNLLI